MDYKEASGVKLEVGPTREALERALRIPSTTVPTGNQDLSDHFLNDGVTLWTRNRRDQKQSIIPLRDRDCLAWLDALVFPSSNHTP